jgi:hypothetical protein
VPEYDKTVAELIAAWSTTACRTTTVTGYGLLLDMSCPVHIFTAQSCIATSTIEKLRTVKLGNVGAAASVYHLAFKMAAAQSRVPARGDGCVSWDFPRAENERERKWRRLASIHVSSCVDTGRWTIGTNARRRTKKLYKRAYYGVQHIRTQQRTRTS